jgi:type II secretory pathway pseudopilin PulG
MKKHEAGFSMIEVTVVAAVTMITVGLAAPSILTAIDTYKFNSDVQAVAATIRSARYKAVASNVAMRVRFNCPTTGQMRVVEVLGTAADSAADRCDLAAYPYPDPDAATAPNNDGPVLSMGESSDFAGSIPSLQIDIAGRVSPLTGCPACAGAATPAQLYVVDDRTNTQRLITVAASGSTTVSDFASYREAD